MNLQELKIKVQELAKELESTPEKMGMVINSNKFSSDVLIKALNGENEADAAEIESFFTAREYAFSIYTEEQCEIIRQFEKRILSAGSAGKALENSGISPSTMSSLRRGTYKGITENAFSKISVFLELKDENSVIITAEEPRTTKNVMLEKLAEELNIDLSGVRSSMYFRKIFSELHDGTVIIVDEAQNFRFDAIDTLRGFADYFRNENLGTVGIVCMGNDTFRQQFFGKSGIGKEQVWNRFAERLKYESKNIRFSDIELFFPELTKKGMKDELKFLYGVALSPREDIRSAIHLYTKIYNVHKGNCTIEMIAKQAKRMQVDIINIDAIMNRLKAVK